MAGLGLHGKMPPPINMPSGGGEGTAISKYARKCREKTQSPTKEVNQKVCFDCQTSTTPLWRSGPAGPKSLCNACGIKYRKMARRRDSGGDIGRTITRNLSSSRREEEAAAATDWEMLKQRQRKKQERMWLLLQQSRKFAMSCGKEEAEAAVLLMAMSSGLFLRY